MTILAAATPAAAPVSDEDVRSAFDALDNEDQGGETFPGLEADNPADGDAEQAPVEGDEAETADEAPEAEEAPEPEKPALDLTAPVKVKVNGEEVEVPLDEALKGYSRTEDYKAKTAALAEKGRALEGEYVARLQTALDTFVSVDPLLSVANTIDWPELARTDPAQFVALKAELDQRNSIVAQAQQQIAEVKAREAESVAAREYELLVKADPQLADAATYEKRIDSVRSYLAKTHKFSDADLNGVNDHRYVLIAEKAAAYDALMAAKTALPTKAAPPKPQAPSLRPGTAETQRPSSSRKPGPSASPREVRAWLDANV